MGRGTCELRWNRYRTESQARQIPGAQGFPEPLVIFIQPFRVNTKFELAHVCDLLNAGDGGAILTPKLQQPALALGGSLVPFYDDANQQSRAAAAVLG